MTQHAVDLLRKYAEIVNEAQKPVQLDEGLTDMLNPGIQKLGKWLMSKLDPETAQQLKQAYDQSGGNKDKFMAAIGITQQDVSNIAPQPKAQGAQAQPAPQVNEWLSAYGDQKAPLKVKILNLLANGIPLSGILTLLAGGLGVAIPTSWPAIIWYVVSAAMMWGIGHYEFSDAVKGGGHSVNTGVN
jgi:hypothetical protein